MMSEINYLHNEGCQNKRLNMNCHSQKKAKGMTKMIDGVFYLRGEKRNVSICGRPEND